MGLKAIAIIVVSLAISGFFIDTTDARRLESYRPPPPGPPKEGGSWVWVTGSSSWSDDGHGDDDNWSDDGHDDDTWEGDDHVETTDDWEGDDHKEDNAHLPGKRVRYTSVPYTSIRAFSLETAGSVDTDQELKIHAVSTYDCEVAIVYLNCISCVFCLLTSHVHIIFTQVEFSILLSNPSFAFAYFLSTENISF